MTQTTKKPLDIWVEEIHQDILGMRYRVKKTLFSGESDFQRIDIVETEGFGRMLFNDSVAMISERDERVYHEMISHVALFTAPWIKRVLVIGGGDGGTVREIIRHPSVESLRLVEIDPLVVEGCKRHIPQTAAALDDPKVEVSIADGVKFVAETDERYDLVVVDSTDPVGPAEPLFGPGFYSNVARVLNPDGIVISQAESPYYCIEKQEELLKILGAAFKRVHIYNYVNLTYPGGLWSFTFASSGDVCPIGDFDEDRVEKSGMSFYYYNTATHKSAFAYPEFQRKALGELLTPFKE